MPRHSKETSGCHGSDDFYVSSNQLRINGEQKARQATQYGAPLAPYLVGVLVCWWTEFQLVRENQLQFFEKNLR